MSQVRRSGLALLAAAIVLVASQAAEAKILLGGCCDAPVVCCPENRCVSYKYHRGRCCVDPCAKLVKVMLKVQDPCNCKCTFDVEVCVPECCAKQDPSVCSKCRPILGGGVADYDWCCGYHIRLVVNKCGDVVVHYYGLR